MMDAYYNDNEPFVCAWMQNLMDAGLITHGVIDNRPIQDVRADEVRHYTRAHWFAGIAGWDYALQLAGWPADRPVWTASLPCQPFSVAGRQKAERDDRHLWPVFYDLVRECRPATIFGEQVPGVIQRGGLGKVYDDMAAIGYSCGAIVLPACSEGAWIMRQRLWWVACPKNKSRSQADPLSQKHREAQEVRGVESFPWEALSEVGGELDDRFVTGDPDGVSRNVGAVRAIGNSIVPQVAAQFIRAFMEID